MAFPQWTALSSTASPDASRAAAPSAASGSRPSERGAPPSDRLFVGYDLSDVGDGDAARRIVEHPASRFQSLLDTLPVAIFRLRADGAVAFANREAAALLGAGLHGTHWHTAAHDADRPKLAGAFRRAQSGRSVSVRARFERFDGRQQDADLHFVSSPAEPDAVEVVALDVTGQHALEDALVQSEARYRAFIEQTPIGVLHLDDAGCIAFENAHASALLNLRAGEALRGRPLHDVPGFSQSALPLLTRLLAKSEPAEVSITLELASGRRRHLIARGGPISGADGALIGAVLLLEDVSESKARRALMRRQDRFREASAALREVALRHTSEHGFFPEALQVLGEAVGAERAYVLIDEADGHSASARFAWHAEGEPAPPEVRVQRRAHPQLWDAQRGHRAAGGAPGTPHDTLLDLFSARELLWHPLREDGETFGFLVLARSAHPVPSVLDALYERPAQWSGTEADLTRELADLLATLWAWLHAGLRYRRTVSVIDDGLFNFTFEADGRRHYLFATAPMQRLTGLLPEALCESTSAGTLDWLQDLVHADDRFEVRRHEQLLRRGQESRVTYRIMLPEGRTIWARERASPRRDLAGTLTIAGILTDVTEQRRGEASLIAAREAAERSDQSKSAFVATMSHEIRTPLGTVNGFADLLAHEIRALRQQHGLRVAPEIEEFVEAIQDGAQRVLHLVNDLFDLSNLEMGMLTLQRTPVDINAIVRDGLSGVRQELEAKSVLLSVSLEPSNPYVEADAQRLKQVVENLLSNAAKFTETGRVEVSTSSDTDGVALTISDTGIGMSETYLDQLFQPFHQEDSRLNRDYAGTGLGLALVKRLLDLMGGTIDVESARGEGTRFVVRLPRVGVRPVAV